MKEKHQTELERLETEHQKALRDLEKTLSEKQTELQMLKASHQKALRDLEKTIRRTAEQLKRNPSKKE